MVDNVPYRTSLRYHIYCGICILHRRASDNRVSVQGENYLFLRAMPPLPFSRLIFGLIVPLFTCHSVLPTTTNFSNCLATSIFDDNDLTLKLWQP